MRTLQQIVSTPLPELKAGDKVWNPCYGFGVVDKINDCEDKEFNIKCVFTNKKRTITLWFSKEGMDDNGSIYRSLFTVAEAAELGFIYLPIGKLCAFWDENDKNRVIIAKLGCFENGIYKEHERDIYWTNYMELNEFLTNNELLQELNLA